MKQLFFIGCFVLHLYANEMGALLFHGNCVTCHYELEEKSAPAMQEVRARYKTAFPLKKDFTNALATWVANPNATTSIMQDMIQKHGLMPHLGYEHDVLEEIADFIYDTDFSQTHQAHNY